MAAQYLAAQGIDLDAEMAKVQFDQADSGYNNDTISDSNACQPPSTTLLRLQPFRRVDLILNASLPGTPRASSWDVSCLAGTVQSSAPHDPLKLRDQLRDSSHNIIDAHGALLAPALCHPHIHLDKPYLLSHPKYSHLQIQRGDFNEAMELTNIAKAKFELHDLLARGQRLIDESVSSGVTSMRAFVEVDPIVKMKCLNAGITLKENAKDRCELQLCAFAQLALFSTHDDGGENMRSLVCRAAERREADVIGSTPYVETSRKAMEQNIEWTIDLALSAHKHVDFHLDYNLDPNAEPLVWFVIRTLKNRNWTVKSNKTVVLGHCTRLCLFSHSEWAKLGEEIADLPVSFVGLPTSDLFMMRTENKTRGTLPVTKIIKDYGMNAAIAINNVGNAFTPQGCCDPLSIASMGVGVYQAGTVEDAEVLYECVSTRARAAIGLPKVDQADIPAGNTDRARFDLTVLGGQAADLLLFPKEDVEWRTKRTVSEAVYLQGGTRSRMTIKSGVLLE